MTDLDLLQSQLATVEGSARLITIHQILETLYQANPQAMRPYLDEGLQLATQENDELLLAKTYVYQGLHGWMNGDFREALTAYERALEYFQRLEAVEDIASTYSRIGVIYENQGIFEEALAYQLNALQMRELVGDQTQLISSYINLGTLYFKTEDYERALTHYLQAENLAHTTQSHSRLLRIYGNIGIAYTHMGQMDKGVAYLKKAVENAIASGSKRDIAIDSLNLGDAYHRQGDYSAALATHQQALELAEEIGFGGLIPYCYVNIGLAQTGLGEYAIAHTSLHMALTLVQANGDKRLEIECHKALASLYEAQGDFQAALDAYKHYSNLHNEVLSEAKHEQLAKLQAQYESEKKAREAEIYRLKNVELAQAIDALERGNREKNQFLKVVAHELQNPLAGMLMNADLLISSLAQMTPVQIQDRVSRMQKTARMMTDIVNQILDLRLLKEGKSEFRLGEVAVAPIIKQVVDSFAERATEKKITLHHTPTEAWVMADSVALHRVVENLLSNAIKYTPADKQIFVHVQAQTDSVQIVVQDEGLGLTTEDLAAVFTEFMTLSAKPTGGERATGLGLAIVKMLVEGMGGQVAATSQGRNLGSTFTVTLPLVPQEIA